MACIITYENKQYTQKEFEQYFKEHFIEFVGEFISTTPDVILPIGTSGSGKSTFIKSLPQENLVIIEPDAMRVEFTGNMNDKSKDKEIYIEAANRAIKAIKQGKQVVFDTTNLTKDKRLPFIEAIKKAIPNANIQYKLMELNPELAKQRIKAQLERGENRAVVSDETIDRHAVSYKQMLKDIKNEPITEYKELGSKQDIERFKKFVQNTQNQLNTSTVTSKASKETLDKVKEFLERNGFEIKTLTKETGINGFVNILDKLIGIAQGKEDVALPEEAMHVVVEMLEQNYPKLFNQMFNSIGSYEIYKKVFEEYKDVYKTKDGKPDIRKIKKEAIGKVLTEYVILQNEGFTEKPENLERVKGFWISVLEWLKSLIGKAGFNPFDTAAELFNKGVLEESLTGKEGTFYQVNDPVIAKLLQTDQEIFKVQREESSEKVLQGEEEANNWYEKKDGTKVKNRITDRVKKFYQGIFRNKVFDKSEEKFNNIKKEYGIQGHYAIETIIDRFVDPDTHKLRENSLPRPDISPVKDDPNFKVYDKLETYVSGLLNQYRGKDALIFSEKIIYSEKSDEAGTLDLLILTPSKSGWKAEIFDWKFIGKPKGEDIPGYKQQGYNIQLGGYKQVLRDEYGIKEFGKTRAIPIVMEMSKKNNEFYVSQVKMGDLDPVKISEKEQYLVPVPVISERTGEEAIDEAISKMNAVYQKLKKERVPKEERTEKTLRLNILRASIRVIQTKRDLEPLVEAMKIYEDQLKKFLEKVSSIEDYSKLTRQQIDDLSEDFNDLSEMNGYYTKSLLPNLTNVLSSDEKVYDDLAKLGLSLRGLEIKFDKTMNLFVDKVAEKNNIIGILRPERVIKGFYKLFKSFDQYANKAAQLIVSLFNQAQLNAVEQSTEFNKELYSLIESINRNYGSYERIMKKNKHELIDDLDTDALIKAYENSEDKKAFILENIENVKEYAKEVEKLRDERIKAQEEKAPQTADKEYNEKLLKERIDKIKKDYDPFNPATINTQVFLKHLKKDKWYTPEFREILGSKDLLDFYYKIQELNEIAVETGYIEYAQRRNFLPFMEKSFLEKASTNGLNVFNLPIEFAESLNRSGRASFSYSSISGKPIYNLPKKFVTELSPEETSKELGQAMILYSQALFKYKAMSEIEDTIETILSVEKLKDRIQTNQIGEVEFEINEEGIRVPKTIKGNEENAKILSDFVQYLVYENRYPLSQDADTGTNKILNTTKDFLNKNFGTKLEKSDTPTSMIKTIDAINRGFQIKTLGGNPISGAVNWFGANVQAISRKSDYYKYTEFLQSQLKLRNWAQISTEEAQVFTSLTEVFKPFLENENYELFKKSATTALGRQSFADTMMYFMRKPELVIQAANFEAVLSNMIIIDGEVKNITQYVKSKYPNRYRSSEDLKKANEAIEKEVEELKQKSILKIAKVIDGQLVIDGLDLNNKEQIEKLSLLTKNIYRGITGNVSETSINQAKLDIFTSSFMVFKNWIPKLWYTRFGGFEKVNDPFDQNAFDVGRVKVFANTLFYAGFKLRNISDVLEGNDRGLEILDGLFEKYKEEYLKANGYELEMDKDAFNDMITQYVRNELREIILVTSLIAAGFALGFVEPPEDKRAKAMLNVTRRIFDQFKDELLFFYNPVNFQDMLSKGVFPALGLVKDMEKFTTSLGKELTGFDPLHPTKEGEEVRENAYPIKYGLKLVPGASSWVQFTTIFSPELAKEFGIQLPNPEKR